MRVSSQKRYRSCQVAQRGQPDNKTYLIARLNMSYMPLDLKSRVFRLQLFFRKELANRLTLQDFHVSQAAALESVK